MDKQVNLDIQIPVELKDLRLDQGLAKLCPEFSRAKIAQWIKAGDVLVDGQVGSVKQKLQGEEQIKIQTELKSLEFEPEDKPLNIVYEDDDLIVLNKPANCVVHPAAGNWSGTLLNALLHHHPDLKLLPRAGIIHRLDKDTTGLMVVAKSQQAYTQLVADLAKRKIGRHYLALVKGEIISGATIDQPIGRHPKNRLKMAVVKNGKPAVTHYRIAQKFSGYTLLNIQLESGRTHQIRVHLSHARHNLVGDSLYGGRGILAANMPAELRERIQNFKRPALHAYKLQLKHPVSKESLEWTLPIPTDIQALLKELTEHGSHPPQLACSELGPILHYHA